jgi:hypothetical protein
MQLEFLFHLSIEKSQATANEYDNLLNAGDSQVQRLLSPQSPEQHTMFR